MARPQKEATLSEDQIVRLASVGCTDEEIATLASLSETELKRSFGPLLKRGRADLRDTLRTAQVRKALGVMVEKMTDDGPVIYTTPPDSTMLIWLGKQYLGQSDKTETKDTTELIDWDRVPTAVRDDFIEGRITLDDVRRSLKRKR